MSESITIPKTTSFPAYLDFNRLRETGIKHLEELGSDLWTDFNLHDPGITILETLVYALTDLGYRTNFETRDLLARSEAERRLPDDNFFTAAQILSCNPVTVTDLRKLLIDIPGVRNAWLEPAERAEIPVYLNAPAKILQFEPNGADNEVKIKGLYRVFVELEPLFRIDACGNPVFSEADILQKVQDTLHQHRNLCEDLKEVMVYGKEDIAICAEIEISPEADAEDVMLGIYQIVEEFLAPTLRFYTLREMLDKGKRMEEIFEGRPLTMQSHGFIDPDELKKLDPQTQLYASDLIQLIMDVPGILAVRKFLLVNYLNGFRQTDGEKWCIQLTPNYRPHFDLAHSKITFFKGVLPSSFDRDEVQQRFLEEKIASAKAILAPYLLDTTPPAGEYRDIQDYRSIQEEFPLTYGIGKEGIAGAPTIERQAQAAQLKAYLLFFDQILANYLAQLAHLRDLFSFSEDNSERRTGRNHSYFTQSLSMVPGVEKLLLNFNECAGNDSDPEPPEDYPSYLAYVTESPETYLDRRNRFLDHLLARFSESFADYVLLMFKIEGESKSERLRRLAQDKADFLTNYPAISRDRGKAFNLTQPDGTWNTSNVSGVENRVAKLIGIDHFNRHTLGRAHVVEQREGWRWKLALDGDPVAARPPLSIRSASIFSSESAALQDWNLGQAVLVDGNRFNRLSFKNNGQSWFGFEIMGQGGNIFATNEQEYGSADERDAAIESLRSSLLFPGMTCSVHEETACWFYELWDAANTKPLFEGIPGYHTRAEAEAAFADFLTLAQVAAHYERLPPNNDQFGFRLNGPGGEPLALHRQLYGSEAEREAWIRAIVYYLDDSQPLNPIICEYKGIFQFEILGDDGAVLFQSVEEYETEGAAYAAARKARSLARFRVNYRPVDDPERPLPYSFDLLNRTGERIATHPVWYATDCERDLAMDIARYSAVNEQPVRVNLGEAGAWSFDVQTPDGEVLLRCAGVYPDLPALDAAWQMLHAQAVSEDNYRRYEKIETEYPFGFELLDAEGQVLAFHPVDYATEAERDMALQAVLHFLCTTDLEIRATGNPGKYLFVLRETADEKFLESAGTFPDEPTAWSAWENFLLLASERHNYQFLPKNGFELRDAENNTVAIHAGTYASPAEAEAVIQMIIAFVRHDEPLGKMINRGGAFVASLVDEGGTLRLSGTEIYPNRETAEQIGWNRIRQFAAYPARYLKIDDGSGNCAFGFALTDDHQHIIANHPQHYPDATQRDAAMLSLLARMTDGEQLADQAIRPEFGYFFKIQDVYGTPLLVAVDHAPTPEASARAFDAALPWLARADSYEPDHTNNGFGFKVVKKEGSQTILLARQAKRYDSAEIRDAVIRRIRLLVSMHGIPFRIAVHEGIFRFALLNEHGHDFLRGLASFDTPAATGDALLLAAGRAISRASYRLTEEEDCAFSFELTDADGARLATHPGSYDSATERDEALDHFIAFLNGQTLHPSIEQKTVAWYFELQDFSGQALLRSVHKWSTRAQAKSVWLYYFHPDALGALQFRLSYDNAACRYGFEVLGAEGALVAVHPEPFYSRSARDAAVAQIRLLLERQLLPCIVEGVECGYFFRTEFDGTAVKSRQRYPTPAQAWAGGNTLSPWLANAGRYLNVAADDNFIFWNITGGEENWPVAESLPPAFADQSAADAARDKWVAQMAAAAVLSVESVFEKRSAVCRVEEDQTVWLESTSGPTFEIPDAAGRENAFAASWELCDGINELGQEPDNFTLIDDELNCRFGFRLRVEGIDLNHPAYYPTRDKRAERLAYLAELLNSEGMHLVEHVLLRPRRLGLAPAWTFDLTPPEAPFAWMSSARPYDSREAAENALRAIAERVCAEKQQAFELVKEPCYSFLLQGASTPGFPTETERNAAIGWIIGQLCPADCSDPALGQFVHAIVRSPKDSERDRLLPIVHCGDGEEDETPCVACADPYSFRASVVLPYWSKRFVKMEFRAFIETTLRREAPAHVFLRICWVNARQMNIFENAFRNWLESKAEGEDSCHATAALNELIDILFQLQNIYPPGSLHDCDTPSAQGNSIVLNQSILGTAKTFGHGDQ